VWGMVGGDLRLILESGGEDGYQRTVLEDFVVRSDS